MSTNDLGRFIDRYTMRHERTYPHPIDLVWDAVTDAEHLDVWLLPEVHVERRAGGPCSFSWGGPDPIHGVVSVFDPPHRARYTFGDERAYLELRLESSGDGTRLALTQSFPPGVLPPPDPHGNPGSDFPAGPGTPWQPGFVAGFHAMLDRLPRYLDGAFTASDAAEGLTATHEGRHPLELIDRYRRHITVSCPGE